jgi:hypothetical protein
MQLKKRRKNVTFELKKYIVDVEMLSQLRLPTIIMLSMFAILKGLQCVEHIMRIIDIHAKVDTNIKGIKLSSKNSESGRTNDTSSDN